MRGGEWGDEVRIFLKEIIKDCFKEKKNFKRGGGVL